jgi:hypothetical protein
MCTADDAHATWAAFGGPADALRMVGAALDYLNSAASRAWTGLPAANC